MSIERYYDNYNDNNNNNLEGRYNGNKNYNGNLQPVALPHIMLQSGCPEMFSRNNPLNL